MRSRAYGYGIFVGDTDKRDLTSSVLQVPDPFDVEGYVLAKVDWERILEEQAIRHGREVRTHRIKPKPVKRTHGLPVDRLAQWQQGIKTPSRIAPLLIPGMDAGWMVAMCPKCEQVGKLIATRVDGMQCELRCHQCSELSTLEWAPSPYSW